MPILKKIVLRHTDSPVNQWTEIATGIKILVKEPKIKREFTTDVLVHSEDPYYDSILQNRLNSDLKSYVAPAVYFCEIEDGFISPRLNKLPRYWMIGNNHYYIDDFLNSKWQEHVPDGMTISTINDSESLEVNFSRTLQLNQPVIFLNFFNNTNHLLHESLPALNHLNELTQTHPNHLIYSSPLKPFIKKFLYDIDFPVEKIIECTDVTIRAPKVLVSCFAGGGHLNNPTTALDTICDNLTKILPKVYSANEIPDRIFVSRSDAGQRIMINERAITERLVREYGFKVVIPGAMPVAQQIEYFSKASLVIGPHGMGINNFIFAKHPKMLMELFQPNWVREAYLRQSQIKGCTYAAYIGTTTEGNLIVDEKEFFAFLDKTLATVGE